MLKAKVSEWVLKARVSEWVVPGFKLCVKVDDHEDASPNASLT